MTASVIIIVAVVVGLIVLSAFFSGSETALTAASRARMLQLERTGNLRAAVVSRLISARERLIGALLVGNNLVNILASALATSLFINWFGDAGVAYATLVMTALVLVFAEVLPKTYAIANSDRMSLAVAPVVRVFVVLFSPVTALVQKIVQFVLRLLGAGNGDDVFSAHDDLRGAIDLHHREGAVIKDDRDMLGGILDLRDLDVSDVMVHRTKMQALNADEPNEALVKEALASPYTRLPLWRNEPENIIGVLHAKDLLRALAEAEGNVAKLGIPEIASEPWFVPDTTTPAGTAQRLSAPQGAFRACRR